MITGAKCNYMQGAHLPYYSIYQRHIVNGKAECQLWEVGLPLFNLECNHSPKSHPPKQQGSSSSCLQTFAPAG